MSMVTELITKINHTWDISWTLTKHSRSEQLWRKVPKYVFEWTCPWTDGYDWFEAFPEPVGGNTMREVLSKALADIEEFKETH